MADTQTVTACCDDEFVKSQDFIKDFITSLSESDQVDATFEKRREKHYARAIPLTARELGEDLKPRGGVIHGVMRDISTRGMGLLTVNQVNSPYLAVTFRSPFTGEIFESLLHVLRKRVTETGQLDIGGEFVLREDLGLS